MTLERAAEILDPKHREHYDDVETVNEACRIGVKAIKEKMGTLDDNLTAARLEMDVYEKTAAKQGKKTVMRNAATACEWLAEQLWTAEKSNDPEAYTARIQKARASAEIALNLLATIYDDCADEEYKIISRLVKQYAEIVNDEADGGLSQAT